MLSTKRRGRVRLLASVLALALVVVACGDGDDGNGGDGGGGTEDGGDGTEDGGGDGGETDIEGMSVSIMTPWVEDDAANFEATIQGWADENGVTIEHEGSADFETLINTRVEGGNPPDIAMVPQPGLMADLHNSAGLRDLSEVIDVDEFSNSVVDGMVDLGTVNGDFVGTVFRLSLKSMVWYPEPAFSDAGYEAPETWDEMIELTEQMQEDGIDTPWCIGIENAGATGWVATDWMEDIMLRTAGPDAYDQWVEGELPFTSDEVTGAAERFAELALDSDYVLGGRQGIVTTPFGDSPNPMFEDPPACMLHRQASFIFSFFPDEVQENLDESTGFFPFPQIDEEHGTPALIAGDLAILFTDDNPAAEELLRFMASPEGSEGWAEAGGSLSPHTDFDTSIYPTEIDQQQQEFLSEASFARFDGSDQMPGAVGAGSFWTEMTAWINGDTDLETAMQNIDDSWPEDGGGDDAESEE